MTINELTADRANVQEHLFAIFPGLHGGSRVANAPQRRSWREGRYIVIDSDRRCEIIKPKIVSWWGVDREGLTTLRLGYSRILDTLFVERYVERGETWAALTSEHWVSL